MKSMRKFIIAAFALLFVAGFAQAQRGGNMSAEDIAARQTEEMTEVLSLSDEKAEEVEAINLEYAQKWEEAREEVMGDRMAMRDTLMALRTEQLEALGEVLTEEELATWKEYQADRRGQGLQKRKKVRRQRKSDDTEG